MTSRSNLSRSSLECSARLIVHPVIVVPLYIDAKHGRKRTPVTENHLTRPRTAEPPANHGAPGIPAASWMRPENYLKADLAEGQGYPPKLRSSPSLPGTTYGSASRDTG